MATETVTRTRDDYTGEYIPDGDAREEKITWRGVTYVLDLSDRSVEALEAALAPFLDDVRPAHAGGKAAGSTAHRVSGARKAPKIDRAQNARMRHWWHEAHKAGLPEVADTVPSLRGRLPEDVIAAYHQYGGMVPTKQARRDASSPVSAAPQFTEPAVPAAEPATTDLSNYTRAQRKELNDKIRRWGKSNGWTVADRGKPSEALFAAYEAANR